VSKQTGQQIGFRPTAELRERIERIAATHPYKPTMSQVIIRGLELSLAQLEKEAGVSARQDASRDPQRRETDDGFDRVWGQAMVAHLNK
jgi:hypothetical protein